MREHIVDLKDIRDSKVFIETKVPNFVIGFIYILTSLLLLLILWMYFSKIDVVINAKGVVRPNRTISNIVNVNQGIINAVNYKEGKQVKAGELLYKVNTDELEIQNETLINSRDKEEIELINLKKFEKSIRESKNLFTENEIEFYNRYVSYQLKKEQLKMEYEQANNRYLQEKSLGLNFTTKSTLNELKSKLVYANIEFKKNDSDVMYAVKSEIIERENDLLKLNNQIKEINRTIELSNVKAPINGTIQVIKSYNVGDYINSGEQVLKVIPEGTKYKMDIAVDNKDISQIKIGQKVKYRFLAFPYKEYGVMEGKIVNISKDIISNDEGNTTYRVEGDIPDIKLNNKKGKEGIIKSGMLSEIRIVSKRKKILSIILEKLNFIEEL